MLGEIFGRRAGLTCEEPLVDRFLVEPRPVAFDSPPRLLATDPDGDGMTVAYGLDAVTAEWAEA